MTEELGDLILNFKRDAVLETVERRLGAGEDPLRILDDCRRGMTLVGERFQQGDFFLAELVLSAEIFKEVTAVIEPRLSQAKSARTKGRVLIGTLQGDIHELGKNILITMLRVHGFEV
ncbi:MAG TPA: B12-binding domain-containing protein, partial [Dehalococcoidia bacterium]|nr:B12-binding domain-containing protein [Dehalococcoidia bacterium]